MNTEGKTAHLVYTTPSAQIYPPLGLYSSLGMVSVKQEGSQKGKETVASTVAEEKEQKFVGERLAPSAISVNAHM